MYSTTTTATSTSIAKLFTVLVLSISLGLVDAHGQLARVETGGKTFQAPNIYFDGDGRNSNTPIRKGYTAGGKAFLNPEDFDNNHKMACQESGPAPGLIQVKPGDSFKWVWEGATPEFSNAGYPQGTWVHPMGFTTTYIASCSGDCKDVDNLGWQKIDFNGMRNGQPTDHLKDVARNKSPEEHYRGAGVWALSDLIENGSAYTSKIPNGLKNGKYIMRSEIVGLHNSRRQGDFTSGPQNYVACAQIEIVNGGTKELPFGTKAGSLYSKNGFLANYNINDPEQAKSFDPSKVGPAIWNGVSASGSGGNEEQGTGNSNSNQGNNGDQNPTGSPNQDQGKGNNGEQTPSSPQGQNQNQTGKCKLKAKAAKRTVAIRGRVVGERAIHEHVRRMWNRVFF